MNWKPILQYMCPVCGNMQNEETEYCSRCSEKIKQSPVCPSCGHEEKVGLFYTCERCGERWSFETEPNTSDGVDRD